ncbi:hypothetical protein BC835DRAFT_1408502 [Cytidiella melzeri]|nr:hypothetical protein BC835DRAFT_1408502 [Cytidiella melzeri]
MAKVKSAKLCSSRQVHRTKLARPTERDLVHPEARGVRRALTRSLKNEGLAQERMDTDEHIQQQLQGTWRRGWQRKGKLWQHRQVRQQEAWGDVFEPLAKAYVGWMYPTRPEAIHELVDTPIVAEALEYTVNVLCLFSRSTELTTPSRPTVAVSLKTLELLYRLRQCKASYSVEAFTKVICDYYQVLGTLGWADPDWRVNNACRACCYKLEEEPPLRFSWLYAMDGNNSLKQMATVADRCAADTRVLDDSTYFLPATFRNAKGPADVLDEEGKIEGRDATEGDPTDGLREGENAAAPAEAACVDNWKSATNEETKCMWSIFDELGIFASACRHGLILWIIDMVRSGELAKYPFATVAKVLEIVGQDSLGRYNIGCAFLSTVPRSSLGPAFQEKNSHFCVYAFHGYSHCHTCQMQFHPNNLPGAGLEDLETMECIFSASNQLASVMRYASPYRRRLFIEAYFRQWDEDKALNTGNFILNNYKQALDILEHDGGVLQEAMVSLGITSADMDRWEGEELSFFARLGDKNKHDVHAIVYVELLQELRDLEPKRAQANACFLHYAPSTADFNSASYRKDLATTHQIKSEHRHASEQYERVSLEVCALEVQMGLTMHWTPATPQYMAAIKYIKERKYHRALNKLQKLVTQRLFELHKLNVAQTVPPNPLQDYSTCYQTYNAAAAMLDPPRPALDWSWVSTFNFLEEFTLLQDTHNNIRDKEWSKPAIREAMKLRHR